MSTFSPLLPRRAFTIGLMGSAALLAGTGVARAAPTRGGAIRLGMASQSTNDTFDSARYLYGNDYVRGTSTYSYLTRLDEKGEVQPEVAESFEPNKDATSWTFKLKRGITFHDGATLSTDDVIFSILRHQDPKTASSAKQLVANIKGVKADGPDRIIVDLNAPDVDFAVLIGIFQFALVKNGTTDFSKPNGTGAFTVKEFTPGVRTVGVRNPNFWKEGRPYIDSYEMFTILDPSARANALLSGDADLITELRGASIEEVAKSATAQPFVTPASRYTAMQAAVDRAPSDNKEIIYALSYLIDRKRLLDTVYRGYGAIANDFPIKSDSPYFDSALPQPSLDHDKAKYHIGKSGLGNSRLELTVSDAAIFSVEMGQLMQREASRIGLNIDLKREPNDAYWNVVAGKRPFFATNFHPRPTYNMLLNLAFKSNAVWNFSHYNNSDLDGLIDKARATLDVGQRKEIYGQIEKTIAGAGMIVLPCFMSYVDGVSNKVKGLTAVPVGNLGGFNFTDRIWLES
jgi:peptide/nickel transport system substrate-binding protein